MSKKSETTKQDRRKYEAEEIVKRLKSAGFKAYFVGGCVRILSGGNSRRLRYCNLGIARTNYRAF